MRRLIVMALAIVGFMVAAQDAHAQLSNAYCWSHSFGDVQSFANYLTDEAYGHAARPPACIGRLQIETWIDYPSDCTGQDVQDLGTVCKTTGSDWNLFGPPASDIFNSATSDLRVYGFIGWQRANMKFYYIHTNPYTWNGPRSYLNSTWVNDPNENSYCQPWDDGNGNGIPGEPGDCTASPIIVPLAGNGDPGLTSAADGVRFDLDADGALDQTAWTSRHSRWAFLALDRNGNGVIDNGSELFGDHTLPAITNGFIALAKMSESTDGYLDTEPLMAKLLLWEDRNHDGISQADELQPATNLIAGFGLGAVYSDKMDEHGNIFKLAGYADYKPGALVARLAARRVIYDVWFMQADPNDSTPELTRAEQRRQKWTERLQRTNQRERTRIALRNVW